MSWPLVCLSEIVEVMHQGINTAADKIIYAQRGMPIIQSKHLKDEGLDFNDVKFLGPADASRYNPKYAPRENDILFANIGTIGKSLIVRKMPEFMFAWNIFIIKPRHALVDVAFLKHYLDWLLSINYYDRYLTGGTVKFVSKSVMEGIEVPLPPLSEQKRIAAILDKADAIRRKRQQAVRLADDFLRAVFLDMFGDPVINSKGWTVKKWGNVLNIVNGRNQKAVEDSNGNYPICGSGGFMAKANDWLTEANSVIIIVQS
ncbi:Type-1 restriction enzyme EcoKI specificity protein [compost metagenome]